MLRSKNTLQRTRRVLGAKLASRKPFAADVSHEAPACFASVSREALVTTACLAHCARRGSLSRVVLFRLTVFRAARRAPDGENPSNSEAIARVALVRREVPRKVSSATRHYAGGVSSARLRRGRNFRIRWVFAIRGAFDCADNSVRNAAEGDASNRPVRPGVSRETPVRLWWWHRAPSTARISAPRDGLCAVGG